MAVEDLHLRRHSWTCHHVDMTEGTIVGAVTKKKDEPGQQTTRRHFAARKRRFSAFDVPDTTFKKTLNRSSSRQTKPRQMTQSQERFLEWFRRRRHTRPKSVSIANSDIAGLLDLSGEKFRKVALRQTSPDKFVHW
jgi:transglutaminase/protease-like cytokinesis protein 3